MPIKKTLAFIEKLRFVYYFDVRLSGVEALFT